MQLKKQTKEEKATLKRLLFALIIFALAVPAADKIVIGGAANVVQYFADSYDSTVGIISYQTLNLLSSLILSLSMCAAACLIGYSCAHFGSGRSVKHIIVCALSPIVSFVAAMATVCLLVALGLHDMSASTLRESLPYYVISAFFDALLYYIFVVLGILVFSLTKNKEKPIKKSCVAVAAIAAVLSLGSAAADLFNTLKNYYVSFSFNFAFSYIVLPLICAGGTFFLSIYLSDAILSRILKERDDK